MRIREAGVVAGGGSSEKIADMVTDMEERNLIAPVEMICRRA